MKQKAIFSLRLILSILTVTIAQNAKAQVYDFQNVSLLSNWNNPVAPVAHAYDIKYNGLWGWSGGGHEYALLGAANCTYVIDVTNPALPVPVDTIYSRHNDCVWHEVKTYSHYAYIISDDFKSGIPNSFIIADLSYLPDSVHIVKDDNVLFERAHTLWVDNDLLYCASVKGGSVGFSSMAVFSLTDPENPVLLRSIDTDFPGTISGGAHDMYVRNDTVFCSAGYNGLYIFKYERLLNAFTLINSLTSYTGQGYNHSSALNAAGNTLVFMDEVPAGLPVKVLDVSDMQNLTVASTFVSNTGVTPHNPFMIGNICYIAYYQDGMQVYDVSNPSSPVRIGYFDTHWQSPTGTVTTPPYAGAWGVYPFLPSGNLLVSDMQNGLFVLDGSAMTGLTEEPDPKSFQIYPNPLQANVSALTLEFSPGAANSVELFDISGKLLLSQKIADGVVRESLNLAGFEAGSYQVRLHTDSGYEVKQLLLY